MDDLEKTLDLMFAKQRFIDKYTNAMEYLQSAIRFGNEYIDMTNDSNAPEIIELLQEAYSKIISGAVAMDRLEGITRSDCETDCETETED